MHLSYFLQGATPVMELLLGMVRQKAHAPMLTKYARMMALVQVRVITAMNSKMVYNNVTISRVDFMNINCISFISYRMQRR